MLVAQFMQERGPVDLDFEGIVTNDDMLTAINTSGAPDAHPDTYAVAYGAVAGVDAKLNAQKQTKTYLYTGQSTTKTGTQRTFKVTGDLMVGDDFQDYALSHDTKYAVGERAVVDYVRFNILNGKGEKGKVAIIVNADGSGNGGENAGIDIDLEKTQMVTEEYFYTPVGQLSPISLQSVPAADTGKTTVTASPAAPTGLTAKYKTGVTTTIPALDEVLASGWSNFTSGNDYTATTGHNFVVTYVDGENKAKYAGAITVVAKE